MTPEPFGPILYRDARALGLARHHLDSPAFVAPSRGVRIAADDPDTSRALREAALIASRHDAVITGLSAAEHWGLPLPPSVWRDAEARIVVSVPPDAPRPQRRGVRGRRIRLPAEHLTEHRGVTVTTPARTWLDCAADIHVVHTVAMGDAALRGNLTTIRDLDTMTRWAFRRRGVVNARLALPILDPRAESPSESFVRAHLVLAGIPQPECNANIHDQGRWIARVDLCWRLQRVIVEYDGAVHLEERQRRRDAVRRNELQDAGWMVLTLTADDLRRPTDMVRRIERVLLRRTPPR
jgi:hypothetical protein